MTDLLEVTLLFGHVVYVCGHLLLVYWCPVLFHSNLQSTFQRKDQTSDSLKSQLQNQHAQIQDLTHQLGARDLELAAALQKNEDVLVRDKHIIELQLKENELLKQEVQQYKMLLTEKEKQFDFNNKQQKQKHTLELDSIQNKIVLVLQKKDNTIEKLKEELKEERKKRLQIEDQMIKQQEELKSLGL